MLTAQTWYRYDLGWNVLGEYVDDGGSFWWVDVKERGYVWDGMTALAAIEGANPSTGAAVDGAGALSGWDSPRARVGGDGASLGATKVELHAFLSEGDALAWYSPLGDGSTRGVYDAAVDGVGALSGWDSPRARVAGDCVSLGVTEFVSHAAQPEGDALAWYSPLGDGSTRGVYGAAVDGEGALSGWDSPRARFGGDCVSLGVAEDVAHAALPGGDGLACYSPLGGGWETSGRGNGAVGR